MKKAIFIFIIMLTTAGCRYDIDEILLMRDDISLTWKGETQVAYNTLTCQISHNLTDNTFRVYDDALANWFIVRCSERPVSEGQNFTADVTWTTRSDTRHEKGLEFKVEKVDETGQIWMWNKSKRIGIVIKNL